MCTLLGLQANALASEISGAAEFRKDIQPILAEFCYDCHGDGSKKGNVSLDEFESDQALVENRQLWWNVLKMLRADMMPPVKKPQPAGEKERRIEQWVKSAVFGVDPRNPDPGRITVRRLNRVEYRNTIRDLLGVEFNTEAEFPADDTGHGFDNIGDVLTLSPMLLEKYLAAAQTIVEKVRTNRTEKFTRFLGKASPEGKAERAKHAAEVLTKFTQAAFRRPVDQRTVDRLVGLAEATYSRAGDKFEDGIAQAMVAVLSSPRFVFREEATEPAAKGELYPYVDDYALASRLSYFLWSSMPDDELFELAAQRKLRANLPGQVTRLLKDRRSEAFIVNFVGQWLQARDIEGVPIDARAVLGRDAEFDGERERMRARFRELRDKREEDLTPDEKAELEKIRSEFFRNRRGLRAELTGELRQSMRRETEEYFEYVVRENRSVRELLDSDYTFLNERLAAHYGLTNLNIEGKDLRRVSLPPDSPRGGILTHGTVLAVTSNPNRTSPVKRGLFILDNILGTPPPPPPPDIPPLEEAARDKDKPLTLRETLEIHRAKPLCNSCHNRMDPLGLALENFNAMGMWREKERSQPIDSTGQLITGEPFTNIRELKRILATQRHVDFYRCLTEKLLTYALGRGLDYYDVHTVDQIVARLEREDGRFSALLLGIIESAPFQKRRNMSGPADSGAAAQRADLLKDGNETKN